MSKPSSEAPTPSAPPSGAVAAVIVSPKVVSPPGASLRIVEYSLSSDTRKALNVGSAAALEKAAK